MLDLVFIPHSQEPKIPLYIQNALFQGKQATTCSLVTPCCPFGGEAGWGRGAEPITGQLTLVAVGMVHRVGTK